jgi:hypothetical protein
MSTSEDLEQSILNLLDLYLCGEYENLRIKSESLLPKRIFNEVSKAIKENENINESSLHDIIKQKNGLFFENVMVLFWYIYASAYERWEDSFDYDVISFRLQQASRISNGAIKCINDQKQITILQCMCLLSKQVSHGAFIENSMISNDSDAFQQHSSFHAEISREIITILTKLINLTGNKGDDQFFHQFSVKLVDSLIPIEKQHKSLAQIGSLMKLRVYDRKGFGTEFKKTIDEIRSNCRSLEDAKNFEAASELRAHFACLNFHHQQINNSPLTLQMLDGVFHYGFYLEPPTGKDKEEDNSQLFEEMLEYMEDFKDQMIGETTLDGISEDPVPDILESSIAKEHFQNVLLVFRDIQLRSLSLVPGEPGKLIAVLTPKLFHYNLGIGKLSFEFSIDELDVSRFYSLKHIGSRHSGQYQFWNIDNEGNPVSLLSYSRLIDLAKNVVTEYAEKFSKFCSHYDNQTTYNPVPWIEIDHTWFSHFEIYNIHDETKKQLNADDLLLHHEYPGIIAYPRADRASLDDWINLSADAMQLNNLAQIRAHKGDLFVMSENHSICYLPDDPKFVVLQYGETANWVFLIRCLMLYCMSESHRVHSRLKKDISMLNSSHSLKKETIEQHFVDLIEKRTMIQKHRALTISVLEHAASIGVSQYADHGLLLKQVFNEIRLVEMIERLQDRIEGLSATQEGITIVMDDIKNQQEQISRQRLDLLLFILTIISIFGTVELVYKAATHKDIGLLEILLYGVLSIVLIAIIVIVFHPFSKFLKKGWKSFKYLLGIKVR